MGVSNRHQTFHTGRWGHTFDLDIHYWQRSLGPLLFLLCKSSRMFHRKNRSCSRHSRTNRLRCQERHKRPLDRSHLTQGNDYQGMTDRWLAKECRFPHRRRQTVLYSWSYRERQRDRPLGKPMRCIQATLDNRSCSHTPPQPQNEAYTC